MSNTTEELAGMVAGIRAELATYHKVATSSTPRVSDAAEGLADDWRDGVLSIERVVRVEVCVTLGGPDIRIVSEGHGWRVEGYWGGSDKVVRELSDDEEAALEAILGDYDMLAGESEFA